MPQARITAPMKGRVSRVYGMLVVLHMCGQSVHYMGTFLLEAYDRYNDSLHLYEYGVLKKKRKKNQDLFQASLSQIWGSIWF